MKACRLTWLGVAGLIMLHTCLVAEEGDFIICLRTTYTTSARIYLLPQSSSEIFYNNYSSLSGIMSYGGEIRYHIPSTIVELGIGTEYLSITRNGQFSIVTGNQVYLLPTEEKFSMIPIELSAYIVLPFGEPRFHITMGGGTGFYLGNRTWHMADIDAPVEKTPFGFGIHVQTGIDYVLTKNLAFRGEIKFRDPQFEATNRSDRMIVHYQGKNLPLEQTEFFSRINVDGIAFTIGIVYYF